jgi:hypothetical protein
MTEETHKKTCQDNWFLGWDWSPGPPKYEQGYQPQKCAVWWELCVLKKFYPEDGCLSSMKSQNLKKKVMQGLKMVIYKF